MIRRDFLRTLSLAAGAAQPLARTLSASLLGIPQAEGAQAAAADVYALFQDPPARFRPMVRWWWNGDRVVAHEIERELDVLKAAGIGGVEINPIKFPEGADPVGTTALTWLSDPWMDVLDVTLKQASQRGLVCDMIVGSGWPFGGEFLSRADQTQMVALGTRDLTGPRTVTVSRAELLADVSPAFVSPYNDPLKELVGLSLVPYDLQSKDEQINLQLQLTADQLAIEVPAGRHVLYFLVKLTGFMAVINGAPGASGPVLNHYDASAVERYLTRLSDRLTARIGPLHPHLRAFFTDSIELEGANWCDDMLPEFQQRRGYDLAPWLPFVLFKVGEMGNAISGAYGASMSPTMQQAVRRVRFDFETLKRELFNERFVHTFAAWCTRLGVKSRMQAYGTECDVLSASAMVDIPECETWIRSEEVQRFGSGDYRVGRSYTMINKFVSSAAHLSGKQLISCEEMTNTDDPFHTTLNRIKVAGDQSMLSGVTQSVLHGSNYSPPEAPFPGWVRYGTYFSEHNTWWPFFQLWTEYKARLSALFQQSVMHADVAILTPMADLASQHGFQRDPFPQVVDPPYLFKVWEVVHQNGSGCDYISESMLDHARVQGSRLLLQERSYSTLLLPDVESLRLQSARVLASFVAGGGTVLFLGKTPHQAPGLEQGRTESEAVAATIRTMLHAHPDRTAAIPVDETDMVGWYRKLQHTYHLEPDVTLSDPVDYVSQVHYTAGTREIFFFSNYGPTETHTFRATFPRTGKAAWLWDPQTGKRTLYPRSGESHILDITLSASESKLIVFDTTEHTSGRRSLASERAGARAAQERTSMTLGGPWKVTLAHVDGSTRSLTVKDTNAPDLQRELATFAGTITYATTVALSQPPLIARLDLGLLHDITELTLNGTPLGVQWYGQHTYNLQRSLRPGDNQISIRLTTTLGNYMQTLHNNQTARIWTERTPSSLTGLRHPVRLIGLAEEERT